MWYMKLGSILLDNGIPRDKPSASSSEISFHGMNYSILGCYWKPPYVPSADFTQNFWHSEVSRDCVRSCRLLYMTPSGSDLSYPINQIQRKFRQMCLNQNWACSWCSYGMASTYTVKTKGGLNMKASGERLIRCHHLNSCSIVYVCLEGMVYGNSRISVKYRYSRLVTLSEKTKLMNIHRI